MESHLDRYRRLREAQRALNIAITATLSRRAIEETAKKLGLWKQGRPAVGDQLDLEMLNDSAIYDYAIGGLSAVGRYAARRDVKLSDDEARVLRGMVDAYPTVLVVLETTPDLGAKCHDVLRGEELFLTDTGLANSGAADAHVVVRLMKVDGLVMTAGSGRAIDDNAGRLFAAVGKLPDAAWKGRAAIATNLYRIALSDEAQTRAVIMAMLQSGTDALSTGVKRVILEQTASR